MLQVRCWLSSLKCAERKAVKATAKRDPEELWVVKYKNKKSFGTDSMNVGLVLRPAASRG